MTKFEIERNFLLIMKGEVSMSSSHVEKLTRIKNTNYKSELLTQANNYGKLE